MTAVSNHRKVLTAGIAMLALGVAVTASAPPAAAQGHHGGHGRFVGHGGFRAHGGFYGGYGYGLYGHGHHGHGGALAAGLLGGLALGALTAAPAYGGYGYPAYGYGYPAYQPAYYSPRCSVIRQRVLNRYGRVVIRRVQVCG